MSEKQIENGIEIYYSKRSIWINIIFDLIGTVFGIIMIGSIGVFIIIYMIYRLIINIKILVNNELQIKIDKYGITTKDIGFKKWSQIKNEQVWEQLVFKSSNHYYLLYTYNKSQKAKIEFTDFNITPSNLKKTLLTYRKQSR